MKTPSDSSTLSASAHALWHAAHEAGQLHHGRLTPVGSKHKDRKREAARKACRGRVDALD